MHLKKLFLLILCLMLCFGSACAQEELLLVTASEAQLRLDVESFWYGVTFRNANAVLTPTGETKKDSQGQLWHGVALYDDVWWISDADCIIGDRMTCLTNNPAYHDGYIFTTSMEASAAYGGTETLCGINDKNELVTWFLSFYSAADAFGEPVAQPQFVSCSWAQEPHAVQSSGNLVSIWQRVLNGETVTSTSVENRSLMSALDWEPFHPVCRVYLPDDPALAGIQEIVYQVNKQLCTVRFALVYNGGYSGDGNGWLVQNISVSHSR